ncbi:MAG: sigma-70 family RNA polymerase sigma factor [Pirellulaceae bacterium]
MNLEYLVDSLSRTGQHTPQKARGSVTRMIERIGAGDQDALELLFDAVMEQLHDKAAAILCRYQNAVGLDADDLVNTVYLKLINKLAACQITNRQHFLGIACQRFHWLLLDTVRAQRVIHQGLSFSLPAMDGDTPDELVIQAEDMAQVLEAISGLDDSLQQLIKMRMYLDMTFEEIGQELNLGSSTVHDRYQKALDLLKQALP